MGRRTQLGKDGQQQANGGEIEREPHSTHTEREKEIQRKSVAYTDMRDDEGTKGGGGEGGRWMDGWMDEREKI